MDAKTIVAVVLVAFIVGGFIFLQIFNLRIGNTIFEYTVQIMVCTVVMNGIGSKVAVLVHIPFGIIGIGIKAIRYIAGINHFVSRHSAVPSAKVADSDNRL